MAMSPWMGLAKEARHSPFENLSTQILEKRQRRPNSTKRSGGLQRTDISTRSKKISPAASLIGPAFSKLHRNSRSQAVTGNQWLLHRLRFLLLAIWMCGPLLSTILMIPIMAIPQTIFMPVSSWRLGVNQNRWHIHVAKYLPLLFKFPFLHVDFKSLFTPPLRRNFLENNSSSSHSTSSSTAVLLVACLSLSLLEFDWLLYPDSVCLITVNCNMLKFVLIWCYHWLGVGW